MVRRGPEEDDDVCQTPPRQGVGGDISAEKLSSRVVYQGRSYPVSVLRGTLGTFKPVKHIKEEVEGVVDDVVRGKMEGN